MIAVVLCTEKVIKGVATPGLLLYPSDSGKFRTEEDEGAFAALFEGPAPPAPYAGAGKRFGNSTFSDAEIKEAKLEHMKTYYSLPKHEESFWDADEKAQSQLVFPLCIPKTIIMPHENAKAAAVRALWEFTGMKTKNVEFVKEHNGVSIFKFRVDLDMAKWEWMDHQAERMTLTDWNICPHKTLLSELGVPTVVYQSYCQTHGGPRFVTDIRGDNIHMDTRDILQAVDMVYLTATKN